MTAYPNLHTDVVNNPIAWREALGALRNRSKWFWRVASAATALLLISPVFYGYFYFWQSLSTLAGLMAMVMVGVYALVVLRTITAAVDTMVRERRGQTWELLMLTGVGTWRVVLGKWFGTMRFMLRDYVWLYVLRLGVFFWFSVDRSLWQQVAHLDWNVQWRIRESMTIANVQIEPAPLLLAAVILLIFGGLELMMSSAIGMATAFFSWSHRAGVWTALAIRIGAAALLFFGVMYAVGLIRPYPYRVDYPDEIETFFYVFTGTLSDNAMLSSATLMSPGDDRYMPPQSVIAGLLAGGLPYLLLTGLCLRVAKSVAHWQGVNEPGQEGKRKSKRSTESPSTRGIGETKVNQPASAAPLLFAPQPGKTNVFELVNPDAYQVEFFHYRRNLSRLLLRVTGGRETFYLQFSNIGYLEAPSSWQGANFRAASQAEYRALSHSAGLKENTFTADTMRLYVVNTPGKTVRIIAGNMEVLRDLHEPAM